MLKGTIKVTVDAQGNLQLDATGLKATGGSAEILKALKELGAQVGGNFEELHKPGHVHAHGEDHHQLHIGGHFHSHV